MSHWITHSPDLIFTGPVDEFVDYRFGKLPYRSLEFKFETRNVPVAQPGPVINHPNENAYTRITEFKYPTGQEHPKTTVVYEYPQADGEPYYPVPRAPNMAQYDNMDQCAAQALTLYTKIIGAHRPDITLRTA